jgi:hypothetical protein
MTEALNKPKRRWLRFSLRTLLIAMTLLTVVLGYRLNQIQRRHQAVAVIRSMGGQVVYNYDFDSPADRSDKWVRWLQEFMGSRSAKVQTIILNGKAFDDQFMREYISRFPRFYYLQLFHVSVTDEGLAQVKRNEDLSLVDLWDLPITEAGVMQLKSLKRLKRLRLYDIPITEAGFVELKSFPALTELIYLRDPDNDHIGNVVWELTTCDFNQTPFEEAIMYLNDVNHVEISFDAKQLLADGIDTQNLLMIYKATGRPLGMVLDDILSEHGMTWSIRKDRILVTAGMIEQSDRTKRQYLHELMQTSPGLTIVAD